MKMCVKLLLVALSLPLFAQEVRWTDLTSNREYLLLSGDKSWTEAEKACQSKGYALFDWRFISDAEKAKFWESDSLNQLQWVNHYPGTPRESFTAEIWQANSTGAISYVLVAHKQGGKITLRREERTNAGAANILCMSVENFWYRCSFARRCVYPPSNMSTLTFLTDYGASEGEALHHLNETVNILNAMNANATCSIDTASNYCKRYLPN